MDEKKTFAEEALDMLLTHLDSELHIFRGVCGELEMQMRDRSKDNAPIGASQIILHELYEKSNMNIDEIMIVALQNLRKELDNYGRK